MPNFPIALIDIAMRVSTELVRTLYTMAGLIDDTSDRAAGDHADATALSTMMNRVDSRRDG